MITKQDVLKYFDQLEEKVNKLDMFYGKLFLQVKDVELKEMFLRLKCEEKINFELIQQLKKVFQEEWKE